MIAYVKPVQFQIMVFPTFSVKIRTTPISYLLRMQHMNTRIVVAALLLIATSEAIAGVRCGRSLIVEGDYKLDVYRRCGEPYFKESRVEYRAIRLRNPGLEQERWVPVNVEEWTYNFGPNSFMEVLIFENGRVVGTRTLGYGD
ncbi:MAG: hypothetical protein H6R26_2313 [Proteobacteria bacterium]|nr:hypothetical protein [Pseudomonadota bacterium]